MQISNPFDDRIMKKVSPPPMYPLDRKILFNKKGIPDWKALKNHLIKEGRISK